MSDFTLYAMLFIVIISFSSLLYYCKTSSTQVMQSFLNAHDSIMVLVNSQKVSMINEKGLKVFGYESLKSFQVSQVNVSDFFLENTMENEEDDERKGRALYIDKYTYGRKWIELVSKRKQTLVKVKVFSKEDMFEHYYQIRVSSLNNGNNYSLFFTDITQLESKRLKTIDVAEYDPLTKIYNRVKVNTVLKDLAYNVKKHNQDLTLILFDIDHFKRVNDDYGHNAGDSVLVELSSLVKGLLRPEDIFARWGGEEFIVLLQNTSLAESTKLASRLRYEIEMFHFDIVKNITCSFGVTKLRAGDTQKHFFERVDVALYEAKDKGRNQVVTK